MISKHALQWNHVDIHGLQNAVVAHAGPDRYVAHLVSAEDYCMDSVWLLHINDIVLCEGLRFRSLLDAQEFCARREVDKSRIRNLGQG